MNRLEPIILIAALGFYALSMTSQGLIPYLEKSLTRPETVTNVEGKVVPTPHRTAVENAGRVVYIREGCWYCHSQFVRPVNRDTDKWGPISQAGEFIYDVPQMFGTRRIGPDLSREGNRRSDEWHYAHHWDPRSVEPESMMPAYSWLFSEDSKHDRAVTTFIQTYDKNHDGRVTKSELDAIGQKPANFAELDVWPLNADGSHGDGIIDMHDYGPVPTEEMVGVEAYMQKIGTAIGDWRTWEAWPATRRAPTNEPLALREGRGKAIFDNKCAGCHGTFGNGRTTADTKGSTNFNVAYHFLNPQPRDFTTAAFKSRTTPSGALPTDEDIFRTISRGVRKGQIMPAWGYAADGHILPEQDRWDLVDYVKTFSPRFKSEAVPEPIQIPTPPYPSAKEAPAALIQEGRMVYRTLQCWSCHGNAGKGDGPSANELVDDWETPIRPFDFSSGAFKFGDSPADVFRTFNTGLNGTPMPSFYDTIMYPREAFPDLNAWKTQVQGKPMFSDSDLNELQKYVASLPTSADFDKMSEADKQAFADKRRWALVYYALSLATERGNPPVPSRAGFSAAR
ncbi:MAG: cytochrome c oxidase cbb3-type subunit [Gammaproteobacteria bacterium]|jgi:cytochrome c oxidase cbb3-type subunit I/II|nr:cytochrome c oxidase cbb3-type subunit [Gammaproteobacteria bacterium]